MNPIFGEPDRGPGDPAQPSENGDDGLELVNVPVLRDDEIQLQHIPIGSIFTTQSNELLQAIIPPLAQPTAQFIPLGDHGLGLDVGRGEPGGEPSKLALLFPHTTPPAALPVAEQGAQNFIPQLSWAQERPMIDMGGIIPVQAPADVPQSYRLPPQQQVEKVEPKSAETASRRPVRQSRLKRNFNLVDLSDGGDISDEDESSARRKTNQRRAHQQEQQPQPQRQSVAAAPHGRKRHPSSVLPQMQAQGPLKASAMHSQAHLMNHDPQPLLYPCPLDIYCPRRQRSVSRARPRTSRASINRLKQAAHGTLPLGGGGVSALAILKQDLDEEENSDKDDNDVSEDSDGNLRRRGAKRQAQSSSKGGSGGLSQDHQRQPMFHQNLNFPAAGGPNQTQRQRMEEIAAAPPHLRQAMLQQLMRERLGVPVVPPSVPSPPARTEPPASLAGLPRHEQQAVVQKLMTHITPQQRHALFQMSTQHQAAILQRFYVEHVAPKMRSGQFNLASEQPPMAQQSQQGPPQPQPQILPKQQQPQVQVQQQQQPLLRVIGQGQDQGQGQAEPRLGGGAAAEVGPSGGGNDSLMRELLSGLDRNAQAQLAALPREQQQAIIIRLLKKHQERWLQQQQAQLPQPVIAPPPHQPQPQQPAAAQQAQQPKQQDQLPFQQSTNARELSSMFAGLPSHPQNHHGMLEAALNHHSRLGPSHASPMREPGLPPLLGGGPGAGVQGAAAGELANDPFALPMGLGAVLGPGGGDDADALRDAMNFFLE